MKSLNIVFAGTPEFGLPCLEALLASPHRLSGVYTQPDRPAGRGRQMQASAVKQWAVAHQIPVFQPLNFKDSESIDTLKNLAPDVLVVVAYGLILPKIILDIPRLGCVNVHASLLPRWRGASPIQSAVLHGDPESGVTIMQMDVGMDTGGMLNQVSCPILSTDTSQDLQDRLAQLSVQPLLQTLDQLARGTAHSTPQDPALVTCAPKITKQDARIDWQKTALEIDRQIRAFNPWPVAWTQAGESVLRIYEAELVQSKHTKLPGSILHIDKNGIQIAAGQNALSLKKLQFPGGKIISVKDWLNTGHRWPDDQVLQ